jgi:phosphomannomutase
MGRYLPCFKAYDVRGKVPGELNPEIAKAIGIAFAEHTGARTVCAGHDIRLSGPELAAALTAGMQERGVKVIDLGLVGTEMVYFATGHYGYDGGVMITASHNPPEYNGMKMVRAGSRPISGDTGLNEIEKRTHELLEAGSLGALSAQGERQDVYTDYVRHLLGFAAPGELEPLRVLADAGNGAAGPAVRALAPNLPLRIEERLFEPDGSFPYGVPNPILPESRAGAEAILREGGYDLGVAWDGDYDRCFFFDETGRFIEGYYIVGVLAEALLSGRPGQTIVYDPRLVWNTLEVVARLGGRAVVCKSGHAFIKEKMRDENATYGGEMSAHHYFRDHWFCDSGMIPFLMIARLISVSGRSLGDLVDGMMRRFPCSGEINSQVEDVKATLAKVEDAYSGGEIDRTDGLSVEFRDWRFNLRGSNTEPVIRLNVESRGDTALLRAKTEEVLALVRS